MKKNLTEIVFLLDRSGSMSGLEKDTIGGFNSMAEKQQNASGEATLTTVLFDDKYELLHDSVNLCNVKTMTDSDYFVRGATALLDAVGKTILTIGKKLHRTAEADRPDKVIFVIITDGMENASKEFNARKVKEMIEEQKSKYSWEFIFLGANIDAVATAKSYGINESNAVEFVCDTVGTQLNYDILSCAVAKMRGGEKIDPSWKNKIEDDLKKRGKSK